MSEEKIVEGIFDGQNMRGNDDNMYPVPPNYASKSKLVQGDGLKLTVEDDGSFVFKQISPADRKRVIASAQKDASGNLIVDIGGENYRVLSATATYFNLEPGDKVVALISKKTFDGTKWAAIENKIFD